MMKLIYYSLGLIVLFFASACAQHHKHEGSSAHQCNASCGKTASNTALVPFRKVASEIDYAKIKNDVDKIKAVLKNDEDIAGAFQREYDPGTNKSKITLRPDQDYLSNVNEKYVFADLNGDKIVDLAVAVEDKPLANEADVDYPGFGNRALKIFFGKTDGTLNPKPAAIGQQVLLNADDGGMFGDPLVSLTLNARGSLMIDHYGGSADRWGGTQVYRYQKYNGRADFYLIGSKKFSHNTNTMNFESTDTNLLTGDKIVIKIIDEKTKNYKSKVKIKPLISLAAVKGTDLI